MKLIKEVSIKSYTKKPLASQRGFQILPQRVAQYFDHKDLEILSANRLLKARTEQFVHTSREKLEGRNYAVGAVEVTGKLEILVHSLTQFVTTSLDDQRRQGVDHETHETHQREDKQREDDFEQTA